ncbi:hypothetical protein [Sulfurimonas marina]|uniref:hypothetical protein n=1 Tax=Sulfurimonas marina TaxID=2590551 RepID=UPI0018669558|nr:hypothetical protein [Sulfurimonas marina]
MSDFKLKLILSLLSGILFSFIFIILAFALPTKDNEVVIIKKPEGKLEQISQSLRDR